MVLVGDTAVRSEQAWMQTVNSEEDQGKGTLLYGAAVEGFQIGWQGCHIHDNVVCSILKPWTEIDAKP
jgi:hypothetical protein